MLIPRGNINALCTIVQHTAIMFHFYFIIIKQKKMCVDFSFLLCIWWWRRGHKIVPSWLEKENIFIHFIGEWTKWKQKQKQKFGKYFLLFFFFGDLISSVTFKRKVNAYNLWHIFQLYASLIWYNIRADGMSGWVIINFVCIFFLFKH